MATSLFLKDGLSDVVAIEFGEARLEVTLRPASQDQWSELFAALGESPRAYLAKGREILPSLIVSAAEGNESFVTPMALDADAVAKLNPRVMSRILDFVVGLAGGDSLELKIKN